jgi:hypothetical protein
MHFIQIDFNLNFTYEGMTQQASKTEEEEPFEIAETVDFSTVKDNEEKQQENNSQLIEVRKLIQTYVKEEIRKIQSTTEEQEAPRPPVEKQRSTKSSSGKPSKSQTPK